MRNSIRSATSTSRSIRSSTARTPAALLRHTNKTKSFPSALATTTTLVASCFFRTMPGVAEAYSATARKQRLVYGSTDVLFGHIEEQQGSRPFGSFLDAGTGVHSLRWIATLTERTDNDAEHKRKRVSTSTITDFTAVTADETMRRNCQAEVDKLGISHLGQVVIGNWFPPNGGDDKQSLSRIDKDEDGNTKQYDTILADYLIGAMDGFSPYAQDQMIEKLAKRLKPGGRLYIVGLQPIPDSYGGGDDDDKNSPQNIICEVRKVRDACILLAGDRCYREYPKDWVERQITKGTASFTGGSSDETTTTSSSSNTDLPLALVGSKEFPILYRHTTIVKQINVGRNKLRRFPTKELADEMEKVLDALEQRSYDATEKIQAGKRIQLGFDYVVTAERPLPANSDVCEETE